MANSKEAKARIKINKLLEELKDLLNKTLT